jgi:hypothetical protein
MCVVWKSISEVRASDALLESRSARTVTSAEADSAGVLNFVAGGGRVSAINNSGAGWYVLLHLLNLSKSVNPF